MSKLSLYITTHNLILFTELPSGSSSTFEARHVYLRILYNVRCARRAVLLAVDVTVRDRKLWHLYTLERAFNFRLF